MNPSYWRTRPRVHCIKCNKSVRSGAKHPLCKECSGGKIYPNSAFDNGIHPIIIPKIVPHKPKEV